MLKSSFSLVFFLVLSHAENDPRSFYKFIILIIFIQKFVVATYIVVSSTLVEYHLIVFSKDKIAIAIL